jgi:hypothetical protein
MDLCVRPHSIDYDLTRRMVHHISVTADSGSSVEPGAIKGTLDSLFEPNMKWKQRNEFRSKLCFNLIVFRVF